MVVVMTPKFRRAMPSDATACAQIIHDWGAETPWMVPLDHLVPMADFWSDVFAMEMGWVAHEGGDILGFCARSDDNISALYIAKKARGQGVGRALLNLAKADRDWITVWAYEANSDARRFYRREGLVEIGREMEVFEDGSSLMDVEHRWQRSTKV